MDLQYCAYLEMKVCMNAIELKLRQPCTARLYREPQHNIMYLCVSRGRLPQVLDSGSY